ncbi:MAG: SGNH/GDSL hydrolase family protein [bacterium]|nr:SGNH/GDSL hydrolase family protein [bacterium]
MVTPELLKYIKSQIKDRHGLLTISETLKQYNWNDEDIREAFNQIKPVLQKPIKQSRQFNKINFLIVLNIINFLLFILIIFFNVYLLAQTKELANNQSVNLPDKTFVSGPPLPAIPTPTTIPIPTETPIATPTPISTVSLRKSFYSLAVYGDSMVDTMGEQLNYLQSNLKSKYPNTTFKLYNYGIGAQTVRQGLDRFENAFDYKTRHFPSLSTLKPDIIIITSFAYNPYYPLDLITYKSNLSQLLEKAKSITTNIYLLIEIAPLSYDFGKGENGVPDWSDQARYDHANVIIQQLKASIETGIAEGVPIIDVFDKTKVNGDFGSYTFTEMGSGIHPSATGHNITAKTITDTVLLDK